MNLSRVWGGQRRVLTRALVTLALAVTGWAGPLIGQESQVPFDEAGRVEVVNADLARQLGLFHDDYEGFSEARLFQAADSSVSLEVLVRRDGRVERRRVPLSPGELAELRRLVRERFRADRRAGRPEQNSRFRLLARTSLLGLALYGPSLPVALHVEDGKGAVSLYMLSASASFFVPWMLTQDQHVSPAMAGLGVYGASRGFLHGGMLHYLITGHDEQHEVCDPSGYCYMEDDFPKPGALGVGIVTGVAEGVGGYLWAKRSRMPHGKASAIGLGGDWGLLNGLGVAHVIGIDNDEDIRPSTALALVGAAGGLVAGRMIADRRDFTDGDVGVISTAGWVGAYSTLGLLAIAGVENDRTIVAGAMAGGAAGLFAGDALVREAEFSSGEGTLIGLGSLAGGLTGLGIGVLVSSDGDDGKLTTALSSAGALAGYALTYRRLLPGARESSRDPMSLQVEISPQGLVGLAAPGAVPGQGGATPLLNVRYQF